MITENDRIVEIQGTAEEEPFAEDKFFELFETAKSGVKELIKKQKQALGL